VLCCLVFISLCSYHLFFFLFFFNAPATSVIYTLSLHDALPISLALLLTAMGIYGVIAYAVGRRTRESGVRLALGATPRNVLQMIVRETLTLVAAGAILGLPLAFICTRVLKSTLFGVEPQDPITAAACPIVL